MSVQNVECQLTQAQLKRYLAGDEFPGELVASIERHLRSCEDCLAEAHKLREALGGGPLNESEPESGLFHRLAASSAEAPTPPGASAGISGVLSALATKKNVAMSVGLAIVLVAMSTVFRSPTNLLGPRASEAKVEEAKPEKPTSEHPEGEAHADDHQEPIAEDATHRAPPKDEAHVEDTHADDSHAAKPAKEPEAHDKAETTAHKTSTEDKPLGGRVLIAESGRTVDTHADAPKPTVAKKPTARRKPATRRTAPPKKPQNGTVRVYDESGRLKTPN